MSHNKNDSPDYRQALLDSLPVLAWLKDTEGRYLMVNESFAHYTGLSKEEIIGKTDYEIYPKEEADIYAASDRAVLSGCSQESFESLVNGQWKEEQKKLLCDESGTVIGVSGFCKNIEKRKQTEEALIESERSKAVLLSNLPGVAYRCRNDELWTMTFLSEGVYELTGYRPEELMNNKLISYNELIHPDYRSSLFHTWNADIAANRKSSDEYRIVTRGGEVKWVWEQSVPVKDKNGKFTESEGFILDITELKNAQFALYESEERFRAIFEEAPLGISIFDTKKRVALQINKKFSEIAGRPVQELLSLDWTVYTHPDDIALNLNYLKKLSTHEIDGFSMKKRFLKQDGSVSWINMTIVPFKANTEGDRHLCMIEDITESKKTQDRIQYLSYHDSLTGLYNRAFFEEVQKRLDLSRKIPISVIMGDVNGLKLINDSLGHAFGDQLLKETAEALKVSCRAGDIIARLGGDEFVILLDETGSEETESVCRRIQEAIRAYNEEATDKPFYLSVSLGSATKTAQKQTVTELQAQAEKRMYQHKNEDHKTVRSKILQTVKCELQRQALTKASGSR